MGLLPKLPGIDLDVSQTVGEFLDLLRGMDAKLGELLEIEKRRDAREQAALTGSGFCSECNEVGRLRCSTHGPVRMPEDQTAPRRR